MGVRVSDSGGQSGLSGTRGRDPLGAAVVTVSCSLGTPVSAKKAFPRPPAGVLI